MLHINFVKFVTGDLECKPRLTKWAQIKIFSKLLQILSFELKIHYYIYSMGISLEKIWESGLYK